MDDDVVVTYLKYIITKVIIFPKKKRYLTRIPRKIGSTVIELPIKCNHTLYLLQTLRTALMLHRNGLLGVSRSEHK